MGLLTLGINHNSAAVDVRERVAFAPEQMSEALVDGCYAIGVSELVILSTCNRTELFVAADEGVLIRDKMLNWLAGYHHLPVSELESCSYAYESREALRHMMQVASGLDSMVLGEPQILGQMKSAYSVASESGTVGEQLGQYFPKAFSVAKKVRTDTAIGENPVSVAYAAVDLAGHIFADVSKTDALLVGAGETIELVARHLSESGVRRIVVANRTLAHARELAQQFGAEAVLLSEIPEQLVSADIVITSTASQLPILGKGAVEEALKKRKHRPILMVDIAVPRDIEPQVGDLNDVYLYSVDDLREIVEQNMLSRKTEVRKADSIIDQGVDAFFTEQRSQGAVETVKAFRASAEAVREEELQRALKMLDNGQQADQVLASLAKGLTNKLIHSPTIELKRASAEGKQDFVNMARRLLGLDKMDSGDQ